MILSVGQGANTALEDAVYIASYLRLARREEGREEGREGGREGRGGRLDGLIPQVDTEGGREEGREGRKRGKRGRERQKGSVDFRTFIPSICTSRSTCHNMRSSSLKPTLPPSVPPSLPPSFLRDAYALFPKNKGKAVQAAFEAFQNVRVKHCTDIQVRRRKRERKRGTKGGTKGGRERREEGNEGNEERKGREGKNRAQRKGRKGMYIYRLHHSLAISLSRKRTGTHQSSPSSFHFP